MIDTTQIIDLFLFILPPDIRTFLLWGTFYDRVSYNVNTLVFLWVRMRISWPGLCIWDRCILFSFGIVRSDKSVLKEYRTIFPKMASSGRCKCHTGFWVRTDFVWDNNSASSSARAPSVQDRKSNRTSNGFGVWWPKISTASCFALPVGIRFWFIWWVFSSMILSKCKLFCWLGILEDRRII